MSRRDAYTLFLEKADTDNKSITLGIAPNFASNTEQIWAISWGIDIRLKSINIRSEI